MILGVPSSVRYEMVGTTRVYSKVTSDTISTKFDALAAILIRERYLIEYVPFNQNGRPLNKGDPSIGHVGVTVQKILLTGKLHEVSPFSYNISTSLNHEMDAILQIIGSVIIIVIKFSNDAVLSDLYTKIEAAAER